MSYIKKVFVLLFITKTTLHPIRTFSRGGGTVLVLNSSGQKPSVRETRKMSRSDERKALRIAFQRQDYLLKMWHEINGRP